MCIAVQICLSHFSQPTFEGLPEEDQDWVTTQASSAAVTCLHPCMQVRVALSLQDRLPHTGCLTVTMLILFMPQAHHICHLEQQFWPLHARHYALCKGAEVKMTVCHAPVSVVPDGLKQCKAQGSLFCCRGGNE